MNHPFYTFTGNPLSQSGFKGQKQISYMENRVGFESSELRKEFFAAVREAASVKSWEELWAILGLLRGSFQGYQYGDHLLSLTVFDSMLQFLSAEKQALFRKQVFTRDRNWGQKKAGDTTYSKHPEIFENGRKIAIARHRERLAKRYPNIDLKTPLSLELCEFIGAFIGDGFSYSYKNRHFQVGFSGDKCLDKNYLEERIPSLANSFYKVHHSLKTRKDSNGCELNFYSKQLYLFLTRRFGFPKGVKTYTITIPTEIMHNEEKFIFATIRGIFDTDGNVFIDKRKIYTCPYGRITQMTVSKSLHKQLKEFLQKHFSLYSAVKKQNGVPIYKITIYGNKQIRKWMQLIGFSNERHLCKIRDLLKLPVGFEPTTCGSPCFLEHTRPPRSTTAPREQYSTNLTQF